VDIGQHDAALWTSSEGQTLHRLSSARALEDDYLGGCSAPPTIDRPDGHRQPHRRRDVSRLRARILGPTLQPGDIVILDNLSSYKVSGVEEAIRATGATVLYLPPYSPDFNPIEKFFSKLEALLRKAAKRSIDALWKEIGGLLNALTPGQCTNFFASCGYVNT
jgi:transposase